MSMRKRKPLVPSYLWKVRMTNLNSKTIFASPSYMCGRERKLHARSLTRRARLRHGQKTRARDIRVNGPPKSGSSPCWGRGFLLLFLFLVAWLLGLRDMEGPVGFLIRLQREVVGSPIYTTYRLPPK